MSERIDGEREGPVEVMADTVIGPDARVTGRVTVAAGAELRIAGEVAGEVIVREGGALVLIGRVKGVVHNEGGAVDVFGFVGRVIDSGATQTMVSRGAIVGGQRSARPMTLARFLLAHPAAPR